MNCNCIEEIEKNLVGREYGNKKGRVLTASIKTGFLFGENSIIAVTSTDCELEVEGYKKKQQQSIVHVFCPFCGVKIKKS